MSELNTIVFADPSLIQRHLHDTHDIIDAQRPMRDINDFVKAKNYDLSSIVVNTIWTTLNNYRPGELFLTTKQMYEMFGYQGNDEKGIQRSLKRVLVGYNIKGTFVSSHFIENVDYRIVKPAGQRCPAGFRNLGGSGLNREDIYITRKTFKKLCLQVRTENTDRIHDYFLIIDDIFIEYMKYQIEYKEEREKFVVSMKDEKIDNLTYEIKQQSNEIKQQSREITTLVVENKQQSYEIKDLKSRFEHLMNRTEDIHDKLDEQKIENGELKTEVVQANQKLDDIKESIEQVIEHVVPEIKERLLTDHFVILHDHDITNHYYIIRAQKRAISTAIRTVKKLHPNMYVLLNEIDYTHPKNLFVIFKKYITDNVQYTPKIRIVYNHIRVCEEYTTPSSTPTDHELVRLFETVKTTITNDVRDTMNV